MAAAVVVVAPSPRIEVLAAALWALKTLLLLLCPVSTFTRLLLPQHPYYFFPSATVPYFLLPSWVWKVAPAVFPAGSGHQ